MTPQEFQKAREELGLSREHLAIILGVTFRTVARWERVNKSSSRQPNPIACQVLMWMQNGLNPLKYKGK